MKCDLDRILYNSGLDLIVGTMKYAPDFQHRRSIRLNGYDYSISGAYFITIYTHEREHLFGEIINEAIELNTFGDIARSHWQQLSQHHPNIIIYHPHRSVWAGLCYRFQIIPKI